MKQHKSIDPEPLTPSFRDTRALALFLGLDEDRLRYVATNRKSFWIPGKSERKKDDTLRITHNAKPELKLIHERLKMRILRKVKYPPYLFGGLPSLHDGDARHNIANATAHSGANIVLQLDIRNFFPSVTEEIVETIWRRCFRQPRDVARLLCRLTTYDNMLPQGWKTSSYLASLALWDVEPNLVSSLEADGLTYTRFVDDIAVSSSRFVTKEQQEGVIRTITSTLGAKGLRLKRSKLSIDSRSTAQEITGVGLKGTGVGFSRKRFNDLKAEIVSYRRNSELDDEEKAKAERSILGKIQYVRRLSPEKATILTKLMQQ